MPPIEKTNRDERNAPPPPNAQTALRKLLPASARGAFLRGLLATFCISTLLLTATRLTGFPKAFGTQGHDGYLQLAQNIARGDGFVFAPGGPAVLHRPPLTPILLAPITLAPPNIQQYLVVALHSVIIGLICAVIFHMTRKLGRPEAAGWAVLAFLAYPWLYWHAMNPMNVLLQTLCVAAMASLMAAAIVESLCNRDCRVPFAHWTGRAILCGLAAGASCLTHATVLGAVLLLTAFIGLAGLLKRSGRLLWFGFISILVAATVIAPWTLRNWHHRHRVIPVVSGAGLGYFLGNEHWFGSKQANGDAVDRAMAMAGVVSEGPAPVQYWGLMDPELESQMDAAMVRDVSAHPGRLAAKIACNAVEFYFPFAYSVFDAAKHGRDAGSLRPVALAESLALSIWHLILWSFALAAIWRPSVAQVRPFLRFLLLVVAALALPYLPFVAFIGHQQYALPTIPFLCILAVHGLLRPNAGDACKPATAPADARPFRTSMK